MTPPSETVPKSEYEKVKAQLEIAVKALNEIKYDHDCSWCCLNAQEALGQINAISKGTK